jgi:ribonuclease BN (tRNA processing enzyme)
MHLKILGCGTILEKDTSNSCSGYLVDHHLLFDCGPGIWKALNQYKIPGEQINHIFFTHFHVDHTSDLGPLLLKRRLIPQLKEIPLNLIGPPGLIDWFFDLKKLLGSWAEELSVDFHEMNSRPYQTEDYMIRALSTAHTENSICYRAEHQGTAFFYSGDTGMSENVLALSNRCQLAVIEASNTEDTRISEHLTPRLAGEIAAKAKIEKLVLTHMYPEVLAGDPIKEASAQFSGPIVLAEEGMSLSF